MANFDIGLSGLNAAQRSLDIIGNNIANAATEGYHRQRVQLSPAYLSQQGFTLVGGGVDVIGVKRSIDTLLEQEIYRQQSTLGQIAQEFDTLRTIENAFGDFSSENGGLNAAIDQFFRSLQELSTNPTDNTRLNQAVSSAISMANQFKTLGEYLTSVETQIRLDIENTINTINGLASQIAEFNNKIESIELAGGNSNTMSDQRDKCISDLSQLIGIQTLNRENGVVDVTVGGIPLVIGPSFSNLEVGVDTNNNIGIAIAGAANYTTNIHGGKIGGLMSLKNDIISDIHEDLDSLAVAIIKQINQYHVQGIGVAGSFTELKGWANTSGDLADLADITAGYTYIRVTNTGDGSVVRTAIPVIQDESSDTLAEIADYITNNVANVTASVNSSNQLTILTAPGYTFDFLPAALSEPKTEDIDFNGTADPAISISGIYTGTLNDTLIFTVSGTGEVGNNDSLKLIVKDSNLNTIATVNIGTGYAVGDEIEIGNTGIKIALGMGDLTDEDSFSIDVFQNTDTAGLLSAIGINTFFTGTDAVSMAVCSDIENDPRRLAASLSADMTDNTNVIRLEQTKNAAVSSLGNLTSGEFYRQLVTDIGQQLSLKQMRQENVEVLLLNLQNQQSEISGVDINEEAAQLLVYQQMFQAIAKYMTTINAMLKNVMEIL
ncbi:MAG: flagellar hook-associated protein FlgK [Planctomycetes bacterium HGW-Planctomycetes-1]|nr:MAG: flagellar hook-associated protein FlgK [Planctomycetes bacterium HGW-Planctomycetes-1]